MTTNTQKKVVCKESDHWSSPDWILKMFEEFYDPTPLRAEYCTLEEEWGEKTYCNPPYSNPKPFVEKAIKEASKGKFVVMLLPVDTTTQWYLKLKEAKAHIILPNERLKFGETKQPARWGCMMVILDGLDVGGGR